MSLRDKIKAAEAAKKAGRGGDTEWSSGHGPRSKECPGCNKKYAKMSAGELRAHAKVSDSGKRKDCPDV